MHQIVYLLLHIRISHCLELNQGDFLVPILKRTPLMVQCFHNIVIIYIVTCLEYPLGLYRVHIVSILYKLIPGDVAVIVHVNPPEG